MRCTAFAILAAAASLASAGCGEHSYTSHFAPLDSDDHVLRDLDGRVITLRGYNVKHPDLFDVSFSDGRAPRETVPPFDDADAAMIRKSGGNVVRLPINWSAFEPEKGQYQSAYLDHVSNVVELCHAHGLWVVLDMHQDGWSKELCDDGAPRWAIDPMPATFPDGGPLVGVDCHVSASALAAHKSFFEGQAGLQDAFVDAWQQIATRFRGDDRIVGYEIFNEPIGTDEQVQQFSIKLAAAIRILDQKHLVFWEPAAVRNVSDASPISALRFPVPGNVYAVHNYMAMSGDWRRRLDQSIVNARIEADRWNAPLFVTQFTALPDDDSLEAAARLLDRFDENRVSSMDWVWNPGVVTRDTTGNLVPIADGKVLATLARPFAPAVGGDLTGALWDGNRLTIKLTTRADVPARHDVFWNLGDPAMTCDGTPVQPASFDESSGTYTVDCGDRHDGAAHVLVVTKKS